MTGSVLVLRVRTKKGISKIDSLNKTNSLKDLKKSIAELSGIDYGCVKILKGYPPTAIEHSDESCLGSLNISNGELLTVEESSEKVAKKLNTIKTENSENFKTPDSKSQAQHSTTPLSNSTLNNKKKLNGVLLRKIVPANNSCLFTSVHYVMENGDFNLDCQKAMRDLIAKTVKNDSDTFNEAILGKKNSEYCEWIKNATSWGGSIEINILSKHYKCEICVVDIRTGRIDKFGEDCSYPSRVFIIYDGIHFDPLHLELDSNKVQTKFSTQDDLLMADAMKLAKEANNARQFTDVNSFKLKCLSCYEPLEGQKAAQTHAEKTGHINFGEF